MYSFLHEILSDQRGSDIFTVFGFWHILYILLVLSWGTSLFFRFRSQCALCRNGVTKSLINLSFAIYIADFFLMPLAYNEIDIEKLPFHVCTAMCVLCFLSYRVSFLGKYRISLTMLGFISNLVYLIYPAGVMWHEVHPLSYRVIQTLLFHGVMTVYGLLTVLFEREEVIATKWYQDLAVVAGMTLWALLGNWVYNGNSESYSHFFNWFFVVRDPFYVLPQEVAPVVMPFLNTALFFAAQRFLHMILRVAKGSVR